MCFGEKAGSLHRRCFVLSSSNSLSVLMRLGWWQRIVSERGKILGLLQSEPRDRLEVDPQADLDALCDTCRKALNSLAVLNLGEGEAWKREQDAVVNGK